MIALFAVVLPASSTNTESAGAQSPPVDEAFCANLSLGGPTTYPFDPDGDGLADVCALPYTRREAVARLAAYEKLAAAHHSDWVAAMEVACAEIAGQSFGDSEEALASDSCALGVPTPLSNWTRHDGLARSHPHLNRPYYRGVRATSDSGAKLFVVCSHDEEDDSSGSLSVFVEWGRFVSASIPPFDLTLRFDGGQDIDYQASNGNNGESAFLHPNSAVEVAELLMANDGKILSVSRFVAFGGYTITESFDLTGSVSEVRSVLSACPSEVAGEMDRS